MSRALLLMLWGWTVIWSWWSGRLDLLLRGVFHGLVGIAGLVMLFPAACYAELTGRLPFAAAEAHFAEAGFGSRQLFRIVGLAVASVGIVSSAAIAHGAVGYLSQVVDLPATVLLVVVILATGT